MIRFFRISYTLTSKDVVFPGNPPVKMTQTLSMTEGDSCNAWILSMFNHNGTHLDFPSHYVRSGRKVADYSMEELVFEHLYVVDLTRGEDQPIEEGDIESVPTLAREADMLFLRTGFGVNRRSPTYVFGPYLTVEAAKSLRQLFPKLRCLALDCLSATNPRYLAVGEEVHQVLLSQEPDEKPVLLLEDVDLRDRDRIVSFDRVFVVPLFSEEVDGMPCTVFGERVGSD